MYFVDAKTQTLISISMDAGYKRQEIVYDFSSETMDNMTGLTICDGKVFVTSWTEGAVKQVEISEIFSNQKGSSRTKVIVEGLSQTQMSNIACFSPEVEGMFPIV